MQPTLRNHICILHNAIVPATSVLRALSESYGNTILRFEGQHCRQYRVIFAWIR